ncbi:amino acid/amide ABC transporter ATP-binding protein 2, HAAT family (TC 3.A.1.4.-) [Salipiger thiooxidans]|uniref:Amino acid/amide ABC transporter ATP-binding protein 2, HAAT family (TC 3.A.1.4.-) n=1 Tax=Salipiger thiooxidans TaxID=282683 RepID=A0A1G7BL36_9RHOB|nr:ATP-binding cassette domain-containing protein [Salipiger thiooxidans]SDE27821.1 amino acid/amide ABC transporter ATP-binding protein 2, HAAT family (TC 3.A.1.4.-) [Salipiger thiooxidans]
MSLRDVSNLKAAYGMVPALHQVDFNVQPGEVVGILGHDGMGKTTLLRAITGFVKVTGGEMLFDGQSLRGLLVNARARAGLGLVPQGRMIFPTLAVRENLESGIAGGKEPMEPIVEEMLALFQRLTRLLDRAGGALSGGEQQLLALTRCLCRRPKLMLLDEPTEGIQPSNIDEISDTLKQLTKTSDITIVQVEQDLDFITGLSDRVYAISGGVLDRQIPKEQLTESRAVSEFTGVAA